MSERGLSCLIEFAALAGHEPVALLQLVQQDRAETLLPGCINEVLARFCLLRDAGDLERVRKVEEGVGEDQALGSAGEVLLEERQGYLACVGDAEGIEHMAEAALHRDRCELFERDGVAPLLRKLHEELRGASL